MMTVTFGGGVCAKVVTAMSVAKRAKYFLSMREKVARLAEGIHDTHGAVKAIVLKIFGDELIESEDFGVSPHMCVVPRQLVRRSAAYCGRFAWM